MSTKKRAAKMLKFDPQDEKGTSAGNLFSPNLSSIDGGSFLKRRHGDCDQAGPLHSTAFGEDLIPADKESQRREAGGRQKRGQIPKEAPATPKRPTNTLAKGDTPKRRTDTLAKGDTPKRRTNILAKEDTPKRPTNILAKGDTHKRRTNTLAKEDTPKRPTNTLANEDTPEKPTKKQASKASKKQASKASAPEAKLSRNSGAKARPVAASEGAARASTSVPQRPAAVTDTPAPPSPASDAPRPASDAPRPASDAPSPASDAPSPAPDAPRPAQRTRRSTLSSEDLSGDDNNWNPGPKIKRTCAGPGLKRKKSTGGGLSGKKSAGDGLTGKKSAGDRLSGKKPAGAGRSNRKSSSDKRSSEDQSRDSSESESSDNAPAVSRPVQPKRKLKTNPTDLDVVLDHFVEMASLYNETVESRAVRQVIDAFSISMQDKLTEKITEAQELNRLKRGNTKALAAINKKRTELLEAQNEYMSAARMLQAQEKQRNQLKQRLEDLRRGTALLSGLAHLHSADAQQLLQNGDHMYGASSVPAMMLEARGGVETQEALEAIIDTVRKTD